jgi:RHS repeat-associated protein
MACDLYQDAFYFPYPEPATPEKNLGPPDCPEQCFGDPINPGNGNKYEVRSEYQGYGHFPLNFEWTYNSIASGSAAQPNSELGRNRTHTYARSVSLSLANQFPEAKLKRPNGRTIKFSFSAERWHPEQGKWDRLEHTGPLAGPTAWVYTDDEGNKELFDSAGRLTKLLRTDGLAQVVTYDGNGRLARVEDVSGRSLTFGYDGEGRFSTLSLPDGGVLKFSYSTSGDLASVEYPGGAQRQYLYDESGKVAPGAPAGLLTGVVDEEGNRYSTTTYNALGLATSTYQGPGVELYTAAYQLSANGSFYKKATVSTPRGATRTFDLITHAGRIKPSQVADTCANCQTEYTATRYDDTGQVDTIRRPGVNLNYDYSAAGLLVKEVQTYTDAADNRTILMDWDVAARKSTQRRVTNASNVLVRKQAWTYNARGQQLSSALVDPVSGTARSTSATYCEQADLTVGNCPMIGLIVGIDGPRSDATDTSSLVYRMQDHPDCVVAGMACPYRKGDLWKIIDAKGGSVEVAAYDGAGRALSTIDENGVVTDHTYNARGWLTSIAVRGMNPSSQADDAITSYEYWANGLVEKITDPDGAYTAYEYDGAHRLTRVGDNFGNRIEYTLDNAGNRIKEDIRDLQGQLKRTLSRVLNKLGRIETLADSQSNPTDFTYDTSGNVKTVTDALGNVAGNYYDLLNRVKRTLQDVGGIEAETKFEYDANDNLTKVTDPKGLDTTYTYNGFGDLVQLSSPDTGVTTYTYDSAGNRASQTDARGITTTYQYDALNRLTQVGYPTSSLNVSYTYDVTQPVCQAGETFSVGRLTLMVDGSGSTQYCHDRFGQLVRKVQTTNGVALTLQYAYTKGGQLQAMTYPDGTVVDYIRNAQGQIIEVGVAQPSQAREVLLTQATYHPFGPIAGWVYGNGRVMQRNVDLDYRPTSIQGGPGGLDLTYGYDAVGNLTSLASGSPPPLEYGYDALGRLTESRDGPTQAVIDQYTYDKTGNRTSYTDSLGTKSYAYPSTSHRLSSVAGENRTYDSVGNTLSIGAAREFDYNDAGRMSRVRNGGVLAMEYAYNGRGEQVRKYLGTSETQALYDEAGHWVGDYAASGAPVQLALWMDDMPVGLLASGTMMHVQPDHLGTPRTVIDPTADVAVWLWDLKGEVFGNAVPQQDPDGDGVPVVLDMRFPGQRFNSQSGFNQNYHRDYDVATGRYAQSDPIGLRDGVATYSYVGASPLARIDPSGTVAIPYPWSPTLPAANPVVLAGAGSFVAGLGVGWLFNQGWSAVSGDSLGGDLHDVVNANAAREEERQFDYELAKRFCDTPPPPGTNDCATLSRQIDHATRCAGLYQQWDDKWMPGRHAEKIASWLNRLNNLKATHRLMCTNKCP